FYSYRISSWYHRQIVSTVRAHDCDLRHFLRVQRALAEPGAFSSAAPPTKENAWSSWLVFRSVQSRFRCRNTRLRELVAPRHSESRDQLCAARGPRRRRGTVWIATAERFFARTRPGLRISRVAIPGPIILR